MPPPLALLLTVLFIVGLFLRDRRDFPRRPIALWLPLIYFLILATRLPAQWLNYGSEMSTVEAYQEGNSLDRTVYLAILIGSLFVLSRRRVSLWSVLRSNLFLSLFILYSLLSVVWSDIPYITLKRWVRDLTFYATIAVVVSDDDVQSVRLLFRRLSYLLLPLSILVIKDYPQVGRGFDGWSGAPVTYGVSIGKNGLGAVCMLCGLYLLWDCLAMWRSSQWSRRVFVVNVILAAMVLWLLNLADSATSSVCLIIGALYLILVYVQPAFLKPRTISRVFLAGMVVLALANQVFDLSAVVARAAGRKPNFTDRTDLWALVLETADAPVLGTGYESFWMGDRTTTLWKRYPWKPNQAHNGYLELYINMGGIGLAILVAVLIVYYRGMSRSFSTSGFACNAPAIGLLVVLLLYNVTEAAFTARSMVWYAFMLLAISTTMGRQRDEPAVSRKNAFAAARSLPQARFRESSGPWSTTRPRPIPPAPGRRPVGQATKFWSQRSR